MSDINTKVIDIIAERLSKEASDISPASNIVADLGADSLDAEIMMDLEDAGVKLEDDQAEGPTVGDIISFIESKVTEQMADRRVVITGTGVLACNGSILPATGTR